MRAGAHSSTSGRFRGRMRCGPGQYAAMVVNGRCGTNEQGPAPPPRWGESRGGHGRACKQCRRLMIQPRVDLERCAGATGGW